MALILVAEGNDRQPRIGLSLLVTMQVQQASTGHRWAEAEESRAGLRGHQSDVWLISQEISSASAIAKPAGRCFGASARLEDFRLHDLRYNFASFGAGGGLGLLIICKLLSHKRPSTTARCAHLDAVPLRCCTNCIGATPANAMGEGAEPTAVLPLRHPAPNRSGN